MKAKFESLNDPLFDQVKISSEGMSLIRGGHTVRRTCCTNTWDPDCNADHDCSDIEDDPEFQL